MTKKASELLLLCAGAGAKNWDGAEPDRPLRTKGKRQAQKIGAWMGQHGLLPGKTLTSTDERAMATAQKALKAGGWSAQGVVQSPDLTKGVMPAIADEDRVLLVASKNTVADLISALGVHESLSTGVLVHLESAQKGAEICKVIDPQDLLDLFPYPGPDGPELRERPAYYYTQSAVIPFRRTPEGKEILITGSSSGRHWVVPKGIVDPGLSPAESAKVEAREEAGVEGDFSDQPLGTFTYEKWGAVCRVEVFAMEVTRILPADAWEESHRQRTWVQAETAAAMLYQKAFGPFIAQL
ncbi:NUDIX domain-containing protein [Roseibium alexandrii]|uniref:NUDIX domain protein n=1 Tax=Roseibium alexandrii TaxID=388408 RepID=A0A0M6ZY03_9HYPH|nr:NUDIX domain-containing protein [Roseibium alexandrii]CTQ67032.1 NUDIX domain protein [Roseibium alexandrii]